jgi:hypothetical protein
MGILGKTREGTFDPGGHATPLDGGAEMVTRTLAAFDAALPVIRSAGWALKEVTIELGLPPRVVGKFKIAEERTEAEVDAIIALNSERKLAVTLLKALRQARRLSGRLHVGGLKTQAVELGLDPIPSIKIRLA